MYNSVVACNVGPVRNSLLVSDIVSNAVRGVFNLDFWKKLGFCPKQGGGGSDQTPISYPNLKKTKFALVNGQKCDETHST